MKRKVYLETKLGDYEIIRVANKKETKKYLKQYGLSNYWIVFVALNHDGTEFLCTVTRQEDVKAQLEGTFDYTPYDEWDE